MCGPRQALQSTRLVLLGAGQKAALTFGHVEKALALSGPASLLLPGHGWSHQEQKGADHSQPEPAFLEAEAFGVTHGPDCL